MLPPDQPSDRHFDPMSFRPVPPTPPARTYVGQIREAEALVTTSHGKVPILVSGEVVLDGELNEGRFDITGWRRVALVGHPRDPEQPVARSIGLVSLVGPVGTPAAKPTLDQVNLQLHYEALSTELPPHQYRDEGVAFPAVETIATAIGWKSESAESNSVVLTLNMQAEQVLESQLGLVTNIGLESLTAQLTSVRADPYRPVKHHSLTSSCVDPAFIQTPEPGWESTLTRLLPLVFVSLCSINSSASVQALCETQLRDAVRGLASSGSFGLPVASV